ncbi:MAG TPA: XisI protein [Blastocatellia bacterium]|nr:XisI protein [Blastocatellia bacterium]
MDKLEQYRNIIEQVLTRHANDLKGYSELRDKTVFDRQSDSYLIVREGWDGPQRVHTVVTHLEIINGKIWIQEDWIEHGIAADLEEAGVPKTDIVLGFHPPDVRPNTDYAAA